VAAGYLVVCLTGRYGAVETWAFDGAGWWLLNAAPQGNAPSIWPVHTGGAGDVDLITFRDGSSSVFYDLFRLLWRGNAANTYRNTASFRTSLLDAGERDKDKAWRKVGATFAAPETRGNAASVDTVVLTLSYSLDGGKTYTTAGTLNMADPTAPVAQLDAVIANGAAVSRWLVLKLTWSSVVDWAPVLTSLWAEYELLDSPARRRRWSFKVKARDGSIQRDGGKQANTGRQLIADLWTAWQAGATVSFRDADYDDAPTVRNVRIVGIAEEVAKPADGGGGERQPWR